MENKLGELEKFFDLNGGFGIIAWMPSMEIGKPIIERIFVHGESRKDGWIKEFWVINRIRISPKNHPDLFNDA